MCKNCENEKNKVGNFTISELLGPGLLQGQDGVRLTVQVRPDLPPASLWKIPLVVLLCFVVAALGWYGIKKLIND